uniref:Uncharacterized protein n=1 Tax=Heterorhabditis bacteriophora TaxID=37862 RepID=A0A1I7WQ25_HETBA
MLTECNQRLLRMVILYKEVCPLNFGKEYDWINSNLIGHFDEVALVKG